MGGPEVATVCMLAASKVHASRHDNEFMLT